MPNQSPKLSFHLYALPAIIISAFLVLSLVSAWTEPSTAPPGGNVFTPLNVGSVGQFKEGGLILNTGGAATGLIVDKGNVGIGTASPQAKLEISATNNPVRIGESGGQGAITLGGETRTRWPSEGDYSITTRGRCRWLDFPRGYIGTNRRCIAFLREFNFGKYDTPADNHCGGTMTARCRYNATTGYIQYYFSDQDSRTLSCGYMCVD